MKQIIKGFCEAFVSTTVSRIVGKRQCSRKAGENGFCAQHQPEALRARQAAARERHAPRELLSPFEEWFRREYPTWRIDLEDAKQERERFRRCWNAAADACIKQIERLS